MFKISLEDRELARNQHVFSQSGWADNIRVADLDEIIGNSNWMNVRSLLAAEQFWDGIFIQEKTSQSDWPGLDTSSFELYTKNHNLSDYNGELVYFAVHNLMDFSREQRKFVFENFNPESLMSVIRGYPLTHIKDLEDNPNLYAPVIFAPWGYVQNDRFDDLMMNSVYVARIGQIAAAKEFSTKCRVSRPVLEEAHFINVSVEERAREKFYSFQVSANTDMQVYLND